MGRYCFPLMTIEEKAQFEIEKGKEFKDVPIKVVIAYFKEIEQLNGFKEFYRRQFPSFYKLIIKVKEFNTSNDFKIFFDKVLPWKLANPGVGNSKELCSVIFEDKESQEKLYQSMLDKNPYYKHGAELSPFSKDFNGYKDKSDDEKAELIRKAIGYERDDKLKNQIGYWLKRGYSENEARAFVKERQTTFSLDKCIERHGEEKR